MVGTAYGAIAPIDLWHFRCRTPSLTLPSTKSAHTFSTISFNIMREKVKAPEKPVLMGQSVASTGACQPWSIAEPQLMRTSTLFLAVELQQGFANPAPLLERD